MLKGHDYLRMAVASILAMYVLNFAAANFTSVRSIIKGAAA